MLSLLTEEYVLGQVGDDLSSPGFVRQVPGVGLLLLLALKLGLIWPEPTHKGRGWGEKKNQHTHTNQFLKL